jgi:hypothetical protein
MAHIIIPKTPIGFCEPCEHPFFSQRDVVGHLSSVAHREAVDAAIIAEGRRRARISFMYDDPDPEVSEHYKRLGERMRREGRWDVKKNERAGGTQ